MDHCTSVSDVAYRQRLRSASSHVPWHRLSIYGRRAFAVAGPTVWNCRFYFHSTSVFSALEVFFYDNALYKFTFDIDIVSHQCGHWLPHVSLINWKLRSEKGRSRPAMKMGGVRLCHSDEPTTTPTSCQVDQYPQSSMCWVISDDILAKDGSHHFWMHRGSRLREQFAILPKVFGHKTSWDVVWLVLTSTVDSCHVENSCFAKVSWLDLHTQSMFWQDSEAWSKLLNWNWTLCKAAG